MRDEKEETVKEILTTIAQSLGDGDGGSGIAYVGYQLERIADALESLIGHRQVSEWSDKTEPYIRTGRP